MTDDSRRRQRRVAACVTGTVIAVADRRYTDADTLLDGLTAAELAEAVRQLAGLVVDLARLDGHSSADIRAAFAELAQRQAAEDDGGPP